MNDAYDRGLLTKPDASEVQDKLLLLYQVTKLKREQQLDEFKFDRDFFIAQPALFGEYQKNKEESKSLGNEGVSWVAPNSVEEAEQLLGVFADIDRQLKEEPNEQQENQEFVQKLGLMALFDAINVDEMESEDG